MDNVLFNRIHTLLLNTINDEAYWSEPILEYMINDTAKKYYDDNRSTIIDAYYNHDNRTKDTIFIHTDNSAVLFFYSEYDRFYKFDNFQSSEGHLFYILIKIVRRDCRNSDLIDDLASELELYKEAVDNIGDYYSGKEYIRELEEKLEKKTKAYERLKEQYDNLLEKLDVEKI